LGERGEAKGGKGNGMKWEGFIFRFFFTPLFSFLFPCSVCCICLF
jgi:hypothetical protein